MRLRATRFGFSFALLCLAPLTAACGGVEEAAQPDAAPETGAAVVDATPDTAKSDVAVDTDTHIPAAPRCVVADGGTEGVKPPAPPAPDDASPDALDDASPDALDGASDGAASDASFGDGGGSDAATDAAIDVGTPIPYSPVQVVNSGGGVLTWPRVVPITFDVNRDTRNDLEDFVASVGCTDYWKTVTAEYGIQTAVSGAPVHVSEAPPDTISSTGIEKWIKTNLVNKTPGWEQPTDQTLYMVFYSSDQTTVTLQGTQSCNGFGGYHKSFTMPDGKRVAYAVVMDCGGGVEESTGTGSHELVEAVTDPYPLVEPTYVSTDSDHVVYTINGGGEIGDMCENAKNGNMFVPAGYPFVVQRMWSNAAAKAQHDPCIPAVSTGPYFNTWAELPDNVSFQGVDTKGVKMAVGETRTIAIDLYADGPMDAWTLQARDASREMPAHLSFSFDRTTAKAGERVYLTITKTSESATWGGEPFAITSNNGTRRTTSYGLVGH